MLEDLSQLALGLGNGAVMLFDGNLLRDRNVKQSLIQAQGSTVVSVQFREPDSAPASASAAVSSAPGSGASKAPPPISLFVVTTTNVSTIYTKHPRLSRVEIDGDNGCEELAGTCVNDEKRLVVATKDAVFFYEAEEKREAYGFEGTKKIAAWFNGYLVLVCENSRNIEASVAAAKDAASAAGGAGLGDKAGPGSSLLKAPAGSDTLTIYDLKNKFIAYNLKLESVALLVAEFSSLFIVTQGSGSGSGGGARLYQLHEHDLQSKMDKLFKMNLYQISISLASNSSMDRAYVMDIFQRYGDHLYSKGDYDGAMQQYLETIKYVEPSYVIRKFLDAQRINNLTRYLQALHEKGRANTDHTTLLLNCYTRLKDVAKLDEFVKQSDAGASAGAAGSGGLSFDVPTAINVCRQANYYDHALYLARKHRQHALYLAIQVEDTANLLDALAYIGALPQQREAERFVKLYGSKLVNAYPRETTALLTNLCTGWVATPMPNTSAIDGGKPIPADALSPASSAASSASASAASPSSQRSNPAEFIYLFMQHPLELETFLAHFFEPQHAHILQQLSAAAQAQQSGGSAGPSSKDGKNPQTIVCNTLLELYLRQYAAFEKEKKKAAAAAAAAAGGDANPVPAPASSSHHDNPYYNKAYNFIKGRLARLAACLPSCAWPAKRTHLEGGSTLGLLTIWFPLFFFSLLLSSLCRRLSVTYGRYDADHALVLCKMYQFEKGITHLYDKLKL